jgi:hypothetical protein
MTAKLERRASWEEFALVESRFYQSLASSATNRFRVRRTAVRSEEARALCGLMASGMGYH